MGFLDDYEPVADRIARFWKDHPQGSIVTEIVREASADDRRWIVKASLYRHGETAPFATGFAFEVDGQGNVNRTSALENAETSAIGRGLANAGYAAKASKRASREEMSKVVQAGSTGNTVESDRSMPVSTEEPKAAPTASSPAKPAAGSIPTSSANAAGPAAASSEVGGAGGEVGLPTSDDLLQELVEAHGTSKILLKAQRFSIKHGDTPPQNAEQLQDLSYQTLQDIAADLHKVNA